MLVSMDHDDDLLIIHDVTFGILKNLYSFRNPLSFVTALHKSWLDNNGNLCSPKVLQQKEAFAFLFRIKKLNPLFFQFLFKNSK